MENLDHAIFEALECKSAKASELAGRLGLPRQRVNSALYSLLACGQVRRDSSTPPIWSKEIEEVALAEASPTTVPLILVDLGNTHDCLQELLPYCEAGALHVRAYADLAFNGYGSSMASVQGLTVIRATTADKNSADVEMIWDLALLLVGSPVREVFVATKDQGFRRLKELATRSGHSLTFVTSWAELRNLIE
jgi:hypothetical protein